MKKGIFFLATLFFAATFAMSAFGAETTSPGGTTPPLIQQVPTGALQIKQLPDFFDTRIHFGQRGKPYDAPVRAGDSIEIGCSCIIRGCVDTQFSSSIYINNTLVTETQQFAPLNNKIPGICENYWSSLGFASYNWEATPGNHTIKCIVDSNNDILEANEHNNTKSITVNVPLTIDKIRKMK